MASRIRNLSVYRFQPLPEPARLRESFLEFFASRELKGTVILAPEGINCGIAGPPDQVTEFQAFLEARLGVASEELRYQVSDSVELPFRKMLVKVKEELVPLGAASGGGGAGRPSSSPGEKARHLPPAELKRWLDEGRPVRLLDTRNDYEVKFGTFRGARHFDIRRFREFPSRAAGLPEEWKREPVVMFCTGGIRCEKVAETMPDLGFQDIYQLEGGILNYFKKCGGAHWEGDCYVFDARVALDPGLHPAGVAQCERCSSPVAPLSAQGAEAEEDLLLCGECSPGENRTRR